MQIFVERSGFGRYGICTLVPRDRLEEVCQVSEERHQFLVTGKKFAWEGPHFSVWDGAWRLGFEGAFAPGKLDDSDFMQLLWHPGKKAESLYTQLVLSQLFGEIHYDTAVVGDRMAIYLNQGDNGWDVQFDLGTHLWDVIESDSFNDEVGPGLNLELALWYEDRNNKAVTRGRIIESKKGTGGRYLSVLSPDGGGLWVTGSRNASGDMHQMYDHNTDSSTAAFSHVISLVLVQEACRRVLQAKK